MQSLTCSRHRAGEWKNQDANPVHWDSKVYTFLPLFRRLRRGKTQEKKGKRRKEETRGVGGKSTNLGQPDIGGHDLLPLMLQERREAVEKALQLFSP